MAVFAAQLQEQAAQLQRVNAQLAAVSPSRRHSLTTNQHESSRATTQEPLEPVFCFLFDL
jgi:hypothetical protein